MILCDLCGQAKECEHKEIEGKEYDLCAECWNQLAEKLKGKGREKKERERSSFRHHRENCKILANARRLRHYPDLDRALRGGAGGPRSHCRVTRGNA